MNSEKIKWFIKSSNFSSSLKDLSHSSRLRVTMSLFCLILFTDFFYIVQESRSFSMKQGTVEKIMRFSFYTEATAIKLYFLRWLRPNLNLNLFGLWNWKILLWEGFLNFKVIFLKTLLLAEFRRNGSSLFHFMMVDEKNVLLKNAYLKI